MSKREINILIFIILTTFAISGCRRAKTSLILYPENKSSFINYNIKSWRKSDDRFSKTKRQIVVTIAETNKPS